MGFIRLEGMVVGTITKAAFKNNKWGKPCVSIEGNFEGTGDRLLDCPEFVGDQLTELGVIGQDEQGVWVDSTKRVAISKTKDGDQVRWNAEDGNGKSTSMQGGGNRGGSRPQQQSRPQSQQRPASASSSNGQPSRPVHSGPSDPPDVTRRRVEATFAHALHVALKAWNDLGETAKLLDASALQASAATIFIGYRNEGVDLLPDPQAPPPITEAQKESLSSYRAMWHKMGRVVNGQPDQNIDGWFNNQIAKFGDPTRLSQDQAKSAIEAMVALIATREQELASDPPPPQFNKGDKLPF